MYTLTGVDDLKRNLDLLTRELRDKAVKKVMSKITKNIKSAAQSRVRKDTGTLHGAIQDKVSSAGTKGSVTIGIVGIRRGIKVLVRVRTRGRNAGKPFIQIPTRYAWLVEKGHRIVVGGKLWEKDPKSKYGRLRELPKSKAGAVVGYAVGRPFMRPAWDQFGGEAALKVFIVDLDKEVMAMVGRMRVRKP